VEWWRMFFLVDGIWDWCEIIAPGETIAGDAADEVGFI
jgi:hypothetical protein